MGAKTSKLYSPSFKDFDEFGSYNFGPLSSYKMRNDPQYIMFQLARYKHAVKLLNTKNNVLEIGCGDGIGLPLLSKNFKKVIALDKDCDLLKIAAINNDYNNILFKNHDFFKKSLSEKFESAVCFDVLSSIPKTNEDAFFRNITKSLKDNSVMIIGAQNVLSTKYSFKHSMVEQENFKTFDEIESMINKYFENVFILSMNDETIHTGKRKTSQYFIAIGAGIK